MSEDVEVTRRTFMAGTAAVALSAGGESDSIARATTTNEQPAEVSRFDQPGNPSRKADRAFAEKEYERYQRMREQPAQQGSPGGGNSSGNESGSGPGSPTSPNFSQTVDAVEEFGVDPSGGRPINEDIDSLPEDTLVTFPGGTFKMDGRLSLEATKAGFVGAGHEDEQPPSGNGENTTTFVAAEGTYAGFNIDLESGLVGSFVLDFTAVLNWGTAR